MVQRLRDIGAVQADDDFAQQLKRSRSRDVVAIGRGVILPHFRTDAVRKIVVSIGVATQPLEFVDTPLDYAPRVIVLILAPTGAATL